VQTEPVPGPPLQGPEGALAADAAAIGDPEAVQLQGDDAATAGGGLLTGSTLRGELVPSPSFIKRWMTVGYLTTLRWGLQGLGSRGLEAGWVLTSGRAAEQSGRRYFAGVKKEVRESVAGLEGVPEGQLACQ
jgi:hypothetical protein